MEVSDVAEGSDVAEASSPKLTVYEKLEADLIDRGISAEVALRMRRICNKEVKSVTRTNAGQVHAKTLCKWQVHRNCLVTVLTLHVHQKHTGIERPPGSTYLGHAIANILARGGDDAIRIVNICDQFWIDNSSTTIKASGSKSAGGFRGPSKFLKPNAITTAEMDQLRRLANPGLVCVWLTLSAQVC